MKNLLFNIAIIFIGMGSSIAQSSCSEVLDISQTVFNLGTSSTATQWQSFQPTINGQLTRVRLYKNGCSTETYTYNVFSGVGTSGTLLYSQSGTVTLCSAQIDFAIPSGSVNVVAGNDYTFELMGSFGIVCNSSNPIPNGTYYSDNYGIQPWDLWMQTYVVPVDNTAPVADLATLADFNAICSANPVSPTATDNCSGVITGFSDVSLPITAIGTTLVTWTYNDGNGNTSTQTQNVIVADVTAPVADVAVLAVVSAECSLTPIAPIATDACVGAVTGVSNVSFPISSFGTTIVTWTYDDGHGNTSIQTQNIIITDVSAPVPALSSLSNFVGQCSAFPPSPASNDVCAGSINGIPNVTLPITTQGTTVVTWTYDDGHGNTSIQTQNVIVTDVTPPVANVLVLPNVNSECSASPLAPIATDNCTGTVAGISNVTFPVTAQGITVVTWTFNDGNGNSSTKTQNIIIDDVSAPVPNVASLPNVIAECSVIPIAPSSTDNCVGAIIGTPNVTFPITTQGTTTVNWTYNDGHGNISTQNQNIVLTDVTPPVADVSNLPNVVAECSVSPIAPMATDNCVGAIVGTSNVTFPISVQGTTVVTWTYDDGLGNTSSQTQNVIITDLTAPVANATTLSNIIGECEISNLTAPTATDACEGLIIGTSNVILPISGQGSTVITWTYDDGNGNISTQTQNVVITDVSAPVATIAVLADYLGECSATPNSPVATDNCVGVVTAVPDISFPVTSQGTTVVTWTYDDGHGNILTQTQNIILNDISGPVPDVINLPAIVECYNGTPNYPTATDNCFGSVTATTTTVFPLTTTGASVIIWNYTDGNGNISSQTQNVTVNAIDVSVTQNGGKLTANALVSGFQWLDCMDNFSAIPGAVNQSFIPPTTGNYAVIVNTAGCIDTSSCIIVDFTGIDELNESDILVYPNPSLNGQFSIKYSGSIDNIELMDMLGRVLNVGVDIDNKFVDGSELKSGNYLIRITDDNRSAIKEIKIL